MLKSIDILLGVTVVMLIVSMCITVITQAVIGVRGSRGKKLLEGLSDLLQQIDPDLERGLADRVADALLRHPLIAEGSQRLGSTIHREEFTSLLLEIGSGHVPAGLKAQITGDVQNTVKKILENHGITNPQQTLENVRTVALHLERSNPELASNVRQSMALMQEVPETLVGKVHAWFDPTIDRVSSRFTADAHRTTVVCSVLVAVALQLDVVGLVNRLSVDPALRDALVTSATGLAGDAGGAGNGEETIDRLVELTGQSREELRDLMQIGAVTLPGRDWVANWGLREPVPFGCEASVLSCPPKVNLLGVMLSAMLLSLGAPFWFNTLKNVVRLRSVIAGKDDEQRQSRQGTQTTPAAPGTGSGPGETVAGSPLS